MKIADSHSLRTVVATSWSYSGRLIGLGWTALLISKLGISDYGLYAIGIAAAALINAALDNPFLVRSLRVDESRFMGERCARVIFGAFLAAVGVAVFPEFYVAGFAICVAAGELFFNTYKSQFMRAGRPDVAMRLDALRQVVSIGLGAGYLFTASDPQLSAAVALYVAPYSLVMLLCLRFVPGQKPLPPGDIREMATLSSEALAAAIYAQGDLLILGMIAGDTVTGYYSVVLTAALAVATIGQNYATTFIERLRAAGGGLSSAPEPLNILKVALLTGSAMVCIGVGVLLWGGADDVGYLALIMSIWVGARAIQYNFIVILFAQHRDMLRVRATASLALIKVALLFPMAHLLGAYGAALTAVVCEITLTSVYYAKIYRRQVPSDADRTAGLAG